MTMKTIVGLFLCGIIFFGISYGQEKQDQPFFQKDLMSIGAYYYPEHWPKSQWERDIKRISELGFEFTHFGEFAWAMMEPREGEFRFGWLDTCIRLAHQHGLKVIMCTPTPTPPAWLTTQHPEVLLENESGIKQRHGGRLHVNGLNKIYQKYAKRIIRKLAKRYGNDDRIWGWQIDNEPHFATLYDYSKTSQRRFKDWLKDKYQSIDQLNDAWGTAFWSQRYNNFDQIRIPNRKENAGGSPHSFIDFKRFTADQIAQFLGYQADILDKHVSDDQWITTNYAYFKFLPPVDPFRAQKDLDFASHTMYLLSTVLNYPEGSLAHRLGSGMELSFSQELAKSVNGYTGIMELQPGQINWGQYNSLPLPGAVRMWIWHAFALGDEFTCTYRFRQPLYGSEQYHSGVMQTDGTTLAHGGEEYVQTIQEMNKLKEKIPANPEIPDSYASRKTAFLWKYDNLWSMETSPHNSSWDTWQHMYTYYENLKTLGAPVEFLQEEERFNPDEYPFMVAPAYELINTSLVDKWKRYVREGGHLILSCRTGMKDTCGHLWEAQLQQPIWDLIGAEIKYYDQLPPSKNGIIKMGESMYDWNVWADVLIPDSGTKVWASHKDQFYKGTPVVTHKELGQGSVTYVGVWTENKELERKILRKVYQQGGADILDLPRYVFTEWREGFWVTVNYTSDTVQAPVHQESSLIYGKESVKPGGVAVWQ